MKEWSKAAWIAFYTAVRPFMDGTHPTLLEAPPETAAAKKPAKPKKPPALKPQMIAEGEIPPRTPACEEVDPTAKPPRAKNGWAIWVDVWRSRGLGTPFPQPPDARASKALRDSIPNEAELTRIYNAYLDDQTTQFLGECGHALRHLPGRINRYRANADPADEIQAEAEEALKKVRSKP